MSKHKPDTVAQTPSLEDTKAFLMADDGFDELEDFDDTENNTAIQQSNIQTTLQPQEAEQTPIQAQPSTQSLTQIASQSMAKPMTQADIDNAFALACEDDAYHEYYLNQSELFQNQPQNPYAPNQQLQNQQTHNQADSQTSQKSALIPLNEQTNEQANEKQANQQPINESNNNQTNKNQVNKSKANKNQVNNSPYAPEKLAGLTPTTSFDTSIASDDFYVPTLPKPVASEQKRQLILDTETTGLDANNGDRIIEIGVVEVVNRRFTGEKLHVYIDPERGMDPEAVAVHGITPEFLQGKPKFADVAERVLDFLAGAEIIAHNAPFDIGFLNAEFAKVGVNHFESKVMVTDSLALAKRKYPGQKNSLDALVKRLAIVTKDRSFHGALLDAEILADVYLTMTGGQVTLDIGESTANFSEHKKMMFDFIHMKATTEEVATHTQWLTDMASAQDNDDFLTSWA